MRKLENPFMLKEPYYSIQSIPDVTKRNKRKKMYPKVLRRR